MQVTRFVRPRSLAYVASSRGVTWRLEKAAISVSGNWKYSSYWLSDSGTFDESASGVYVTLVIGLGRASDGRPTIRSLGCTAKIDNMKLRLSGGHSWLYNLFLSYAEKLLKPTLQTKLCAAARHAIDKIAARELATFPVRAALGQGPNWMIDYRLVSSPTFSRGYVEASLRGEIFSAADKRRAALEPPSLPSPGGNIRMVQFTVSNYVLNTAGQALHRRGVLVYRLTKDKLPDNTKGLLRTSCDILDGCIGAIVQPVGRKYPDSYVEIDVQTSTGPKAIIDRKLLTGIFVGNMKFEARLSNGSLAPLFQMSVTSNIKVAPKLAGTVLKATVASMENKLAVQPGSSVGPVSAELLKLLFDVVKHTVLIPKLNEAGEKGFPLPTTKHVRYVNTGLSLYKDFARMSADIRTK